MNRQPLLIDLGAPLRLTSPIKLNYKKSQQVTSIAFVSQLPQGGKDYWEKPGYEWLGGFSSRY
jgi:DMSO/TMAO reductase YedYZ molybdopterin-dependent catalytic subunit